jgi:hypothetical protein
MGADRMVAFYGVRYAVETDDGEVAALYGYAEGGFKAAVRAAGLEYYLGLDEREVMHLYVGSLLVVASRERLGEKDVAYRAVPDEELHRTMAEVRAKLQEIGVKETPMLHIEYQPDS